MLPKVGTWSAVCFTTIHKMAGINVNVEVNVKPDNSIDVRSTDNTLPS